MLIQHLPRESALAREIHGEAADWGLSEHLLAAAVDHLAVGNWMFASAHAERGRSPDRPKPVPRPGLGEADTEGAKEPEPAGPEEIAAFFGATS